MTALGHALRGFQKVFLSALASLGGQPARLSQPPNQEKFLKARDAARLIRGSLGTSGIMAVGLHAESSKHLNQQFQNRHTQKHYIAMLDGWVTDNQGRIEAAIAKDNLLFPRVKICEQTGKLATTDYTVLRRLHSPKRTLVLFKPVTGRTHQLRIHSLYFGHPILGCDLYNNQHSQGYAGRLMLHASQLSFQHPSKAILMHGQSPCPF